MKRKFDVGEMWRLNRRKSKFIRKIDLQGFVSVRFGSENELNRVTFCFEYDLFLLQTELRTVFGRQFDKLSNRETK